MLEKKEKLKKRSEEEKDAGKKKELKNEYATVKEELNEALKESKKKLGKKLNEIFFTDLLGFWSGYKVITPNQTYKVAFFPNKNKNLLPQSHTCFYTLDLPQYESKEKMRTKLKQALQMGEEHLGLL